MVHSFRLICWSISLHIPGPHNAWLLGGYAAPECSADLWMTDDGARGRRLYRVLSKLFITFLRLFSRLKSEGRNTIEKS